MLSPFRIRQIQQSGCRISRRILQIVVVLVLSGGFLLQGVGSGIQDRAYAYTVGSYEIWVNRLQNVVTVYQYTDKGYWVPVKAMICSTGKNNSTPLGAFSVASKSTWGSLYGGVSGQYTTQFYRDFLFHSVPYSRYGDKSSLKADYYNLLGQQASMGCVRLQVADAKWIYDYCPYGTPVHVYENSNPPDLGIPTIFPLTSDVGWDPTDPDPDNPYQKNISAIRFTTPEGRVLLNGEQLQLSSELVTSGSINDCARAVRWESSDTAVATVNSTGLVTAHANGTASVRVITIGGKEASYTIRIGKRVSSLNIESPVTLLNGAWTAMEISALPSDASNPKASYTSSNPTVATVTPEGLIKAESVGTTIITATATDGSGVTAQHELEVFNYQVEFRDWDGSLIASQSLSRGGVVNYPSDPQRDDDEGNHYDFRYWSKDIDQDSHLITATAVYETTPLDPLSASIQTEESGDVSPAETPSEAGVHEYSGLNRYDTSDLVATSFVLQNGRAIITTGRDFPDALASSTLAGVYGCPVMLTDPAQLSWETYFSLFKLNVTDVTVIGGTNAVSEAVCERIAQVLRENAAARGGESMARIGGSDRYTTAQQIYDHLPQSELSGTVILATGENFPDALSVAPFAYAEKAPIFLVNGLGQLSAVSEQNILNGNFERVLILGGEQAVSSAVELDLVNQLGRDKVVRLGGANRYETSLLIADYALSAGVLDVGHLGIATGRNFPDALVSAAKQGSGQSILLLVDANTQGLVCKDFISENSDAVISTHWYGGTGVLGRNLRQQLLDLL